MAKLINTFGKQKWSQMWQSELPSERRYTVEDWMFFHKLELRFRPTAVSFLLASILFSRATCFRFLKL